jgi:hydrogenase expression/formation protein HypE
LNRITLAHGAGGSMMQDLIKKYILKYLGGSGSEVPLEALDDSSVVNDIVLTTDSHTVKPLFFPGGDIGRLAVAGTVNDIAVMGAEPIALTSGMVLEEGLQIEILEKILKSMQIVCQEAGIFITAGDIKVVEKGALDKLFINTSGIGRRNEALENNLAEIKKYRDIDFRWLLDSNLKAGDKIIISGTIGDHGVAILSSREDYNFKSRIISDVTPLNKMIMKLLKIGGILSMKDPTRGGLSNALNEWKERSKVGILIYEEDIPIKNGVKSACEMLGIDPLEIGNEGKIVIAAMPSKVDEILDELKKSNEGKDAQIIGEVTEEFEQVVLKTKIGGKRIIIPPVGDPIPRIC